jgi:hypothetical protein
MISVSAKKMSDDPAFPIAVPKREVVPATRYSSQSTDLRM